MERHFDEDLEILKSDLLDMANLTDKAIKKAVDAVITFDRVKADEVIEDDKIINDLEIKNEENAISLLATKQPLAGDLRFLTTAMKLNAELERIGDLAVNVAQRAKEICYYAKSTELVFIPQLGQKAGEMTKKTYR